MDDLITFILQSLFEVDHEQRTTFGNNVVNVANIPERIVKLGGGQSIDSIDHDLQGVGQSIGIIHVAEIGGRLEKSCQAPVEHFPSMIKIAMLDGYAGFLEI